MKIPKRLSGFSIFKESLRNRELLTRSVAKKSADLQFFRKGQDCTVKEE